VVFEADVALEFNLSSGEWFFATIRKDLLNTADCRGALALLELSGDVLRE
jgi:hypothetical protein